MTGTVARAAGRAKGLPQLVRRMRVVREPVAFAAAEIRRAPSTGRYRLRSSGYTVCLRHHENDLGALDDVAIADEYRPPPPLGRWLASRRPLRVLDLGGHVGLFALDTFARYDDVQVTAVEPDSASLGLYRQTVELNGLERRVTLVEGAAAAAPGRLQFRTGLGVASHAVPPGASGGREVAAVDVLPMMQQADLVKVDVEGAEWALLADPRAASALGPALVLEFHDLGCPQPDAERAAVRYVEEAGLYVWPEILRRPGMGMLWAFDRALVGCRREVSG